MSETTAAPVAQTTEGGKAPRRNQNRERKPKAEGADGAAAAPADATTAAPVVDDATAGAQAEGEGTKRRSQRRFNGRRRRRGGAGTAAAGAATEGEADKTEGGRGRGRRQRAPRPPPNISDPLDMFSGDKAQDDPKASLAEWIKVWPSRDRWNRVASFCTQEGDGMPNIRLVEVKSVDDEGNVVIYTTVDSARAQIPANPRAALLLNWPTSRRWINIRGTAEVLDVADADAQWATLSRLRQLRAWSALQSAAATTTDDITNAAKEAETRFADQPIPRPERWVGYKISPTAIEFNSQRFPPQNILFERHGGSGAWGKRLQHA